MRSNQTEIKSENGQLMFNCYTDSTTCIWDTDDWLLCDPKTFLKNRTIISSRPVIHAGSSPEKNRTHSAFIADDWIKYKGSKYRQNARRKVWCPDQDPPGGKVKTLESTFAHMTSKDPDRLKSLDVVILHVGTNNVSDWDRSENKVDDYRDTIDTLKYVNPNVNV